ncbi:hypothetical protein OIU77_016008 [Salix suchowensis]|uniref:Uncharacterized protein n=1 Tax=Salix suchowensis TaxID=1278906 RepID=A0ABQ8ZJ05_9ROSI|nr:hypothetical protein OIU77_016008 [Salix suchowensis]
MITTVDSSSFTFNHLIIVRRIVRWAGKALLLLGPSLNQPLSEPAQTISRPTTTQLIKTKPARTVHVPTKPLHSNPTPIRRSVLVTAHSNLLPLCLSKPLQINLERLHVFLEAQGRHGPQEIITVDCLSLLSLALVGGLSCDEADELGHAFLHRLLGVLGDFSVCWECFFHDPTNVGYR